MKLSGIFLVEAKSVDQSDIYQFLIELEQQVFPMNLKYQIVFPLLDLKFVIFCQLQLK